ncbi:protein NKG7-like [Heteronotia binoei]|uniref:protein NKG7-like n=1 Tax=Heteronotia binoei TaxID=13085 RepID=UPI00293042E0|nr:protein NKG7-like [Heteronotia binoei]
MLACRILSLLVACSSLVCLLTALTTDYWLVAYGAKDIAHSGLWKTCLAGHCFVPAVPDDYIVVTRVFLILASLAAFSVTVSLIAFFIQCTGHNMRESFIASISAFAAGLCTLIAVATYTAESWENKDTSIQRTYEWSFYLAWAAFPMLLLAGILSLLLHLRSPASSYERILDDPGTCHLAGVILSCVATVLVTVAVSTEFWVKRFVRGIFVFRGLWKDCQMGSCSRLAKVPYKPYKFMSSYSAGLKVESGT